MTLGGPTAAAVRALLGAACVLVPAWVAGTRWSTLLAGHPAYPALLGALALLGAVVLVAGGVRVRRRTRQDGHLAGRGQRRLPPVMRAARVAGGVALVVAVVVVLAATAWLRPYAAGPVAVAAAAPSAAVDVVDGPTSWELRPRTAPAAGAAGVVFLPGALVDPRAYLAVLRPLAERGHPVVVVKPPFGVALLSSAGTVLDAHPEVARWAVGGHSLGGVAAARAAATGDPRIRGVFLWASYPDGDLSGAPLAAASVSGDRDTLTTPADVAASRARLPPGTAFTVVPGAVHAFFGDYGPQAGDGVPATDRADAQRQIVAATERFVAAL